jgi:outer membrane protein TolC
VRFRRSSDWKESWLAGNWEGEQMMKTAATLAMISAVSAWAQGEMSLKEAVRLALERNKSLQASAAGETAAHSRIAEAKAGFLPRVNYSESWTRSNNPVFVFSSLLTQHQFTEQNFRIGPLNRPDFLNNFQSLVTADQTVYDGGRTRYGVRSAKLTKDIASENRRLTEMEVIANVVRAYYGAVLSAEQLKAASQATRSAEADLRRAEAIRSAGMSTDSDVLSIRVHMAAVQEQRIRRSADLEVASATLNEVLGLPLDTLHDLTTLLARASLDDSLLAESESNALVDRAEARQAKLAVTLAENQVSNARVGRLPEVVLRGAFEADRQRFYDKGGANWLVSVGLRWNLFNGFSDRARIDEAKSLLRRSEAEEERTVSTIRLQVRRAFADLRAAEQRIEVAKASVEEAAESLRIVQNRYAAGMSNITDLLRNETAALEARTRYLAAIHDQRIAATMLELACGRLNANSEVLN